MKITHNLPKISISKDSDTSQFILSNRTGGYLMLAKPAISKYNGLFINDGFDVYKILEDISISSDIKEIENRLGRIHRIHDDNKESFSFPQGASGIKYRLTKKAEITIDFDVRKINDLRMFGRHYKTDIGKHTILLQFTKKTDWRDDGEEDRHEYDLFIALHAEGFDPDKDYRFTNTWEERYYEYDYNRKDFPVYRYIYRPFTIKAKSLLIAVGKTADTAIAELDKLKDKTTEKNGYDHIDRDDDIHAAYICAQDSLRKLQTEHDKVPRLYAGYPWFFQLWSRDENISLGALTQLNKYEETKLILDQYLKNISKDGRLPNLIPSPHLGSSDSVGWFWKRISDLIDTHPKSFSKKELDDITVTLGTSIHLIEKNYLKEGMIFNNAKESWMDTTWDNQDTREGFCIEIQALHLSMLKLMHRLSGDKSYKEKEMKLKSRVRESFWNNKTLSDMSSDPTARPNIFIAYYTYPDLLTEDEWTICFKDNLDKTWLEWGGISTIDKNNTLFCNEYTGRDNQSYHRGDSWFWINNLAAICLHRNNPKEFAKNIDAIMNASAQEILWHGAIGHAAELCSAKELGSKGCFAQAWSSSMFIELIKEVY